MTTLPNTLFYGDNLEVLRKHLVDESIDLIYLDPPFNSKADYNVLFKEPTGEGSVAQIQAFSDFWHWDEAARHSYEYLTSNEVNDKVADLAESLFKLLGKNDLSAYLFMMATRIIELHRVLKDEGSIFLHCDSNASHYLKLVLDAIFGPSQFRNEITWKRITAHSDAKRFGRVADRLLFYSKTDGYTFHKQTAPRKKEYIDSKFTHKDKDGRLFRLDNLNPPGGRGPVYTFHGIKRPWRFTEPKMLQLEKEGKIYTQSRVPQRIVYLDELEAKGGAVVHEIWDDIAPINSMAEERLGFPTQKPVKLLERIIEACCDKGDWVLDPFCGCGTAIIAAEKLERRWIGIDITYLAINLVKNRLKDSFPHCKFMVEGEPRDLGAATELAKDRYQFHWWALSMIPARPVGSTMAKPQEGKKGADEGVDGWIRFADGPEGHFEKVVVQVKSGHVGVKDIRELRDVVNRQKAAMGVFLTLEEPTGEMMKEVKATDPYVSSRWRHEYPKIQILTVEQLLRGKRPDMPTTVNPFQEAPRVEKTLRIPRQTKLPAIPKD
jgi:site-specific DNA-methyltransferase (adenine-specific)